jgi:hypothetical protein
MSALGAFSALPHDVLLLVLLALPLDARLRCSVLSKAFDALLRTTPSLWARLSFAGVPQRVDDLELARLCARAGPLLRSLDASAETCAGLTADGILAALQAGAAMEQLALDVWRAPVEPGHLFTKAQAAALKTLCPLLTGGCYIVHGAPAAIGEDVLQDLYKQASARVTEKRFGYPKALLALLPVLPAEASVRWIGVHTGATGAAKALALTSLLALAHDAEFMLANSIALGDDGARALARAIARNTSLQLLAVGSNGIGDSGAEALAQALAMPNSSLHYFGLRINNIGDAGALSGDPVEKPSGEVCHALPAKWRPQYFGAPGERIILHVWRAHGKHAVPASWSRNVAAARRLPKEVL